MDKNHRISVLNNNFAVDQVREGLPVGVTLFNGEYLLTTRQVADFYEVEERTIRRLVEDNRKEIESNGYRNLKGDELKAFRIFGKDKNVLTKKATIVSVFTFKAFLNAGMLLKGSAKAQQVRQLLLDTAISVINERAGGSTKYINQRDENFLPALFQNENYNEKFRQALAGCVAMGQGKFPKFNNLIYKTVFKESARKYKEILDLGKKDRSRDTMYSEVLNAISSVENGVATLIRQEYDKKGGKLSKAETEALFRGLDDNPFLKPQIEDARAKMASFDKEFRRKNHISIAEYISPLNQEAYERFLGKKSKELSARISENLEEFKRLKDK
ncbi:MAG: ORF6N domain-containing protein [Candidatus Nomurabacteria bacterium]|jgi:hypothetical protein|nr:ORF6N domain-containing protein [Candidatus Nomurabacteria bacterium]